MKLIRALLLALVAVLPPFAHADYQPVAEPVADNVYAIVGPVGQRSPDNDGLNATFAFVVTDAGVILIDSGASRKGAEKLAAAIRKVTAKRVRWVVNTGSQDHRWLGNDYFAERGADVLALTRTAASQARYAEQHMLGLQKLLGARLDGTQPMPAMHTSDGDRASLTLGGETLELIATDAHFPGDAMVWLPRQRVAVTGDLVFVDRLLGVLPWSSVKNGQRAFQALAALQPARIVPGHGRVCDLAQAQRETGDYYDFLADTIGKAAQDMESMADTLAKYADLPQFSGLENYAGLHKANMNRAFTEYEAP
ncbi:MBL fold metallo-hydrolase [Parasulfuritortus cantonensis]|uniref:MBL fold metallo-hydrolase n=1 Tax=Parasulfuritortus cantonensis TaxID=2528202 RepID=A0A4R1B921_9PROT|nr:MBL fold metallo-hydrolase [Parasulfuritortus cantonensis]TCJ12969.1 MBL fold metallo-hydrolase [Parasulfuritortus cantonensis]